MIDLPRAFLTVAREVRSGHFKARVIRLGLVDDVVSFVLNPALRSTISAPAMHTMDSVRTEMKAGRFAALAPVR